MPLADCDLQSRMLPFFLFSPIPSNCKIRMLTWKLSQLDIELLMEYEWESPRWHRCGFYPSGAALNASKHDFGLWDFTYLHKEKDILLWNLEVMSLFKGAVSVVLILYFSILLWMFCDIMAESIEPDLVFVVCWKGQDCLLAAVWTVKKDRSV